jgi:hypothetical protein
MSWEVFEKANRRSTTPIMTISKLGRLAFNSASAKILHDKAVETVLLLWDKDTRRVGVRSIAKKDARSYTVRFARKNASAGFAAKPFLAHIGYDYSETQSFPCEWNDDEQMFVIGLDRNTSPDKQQASGPARFPREKRTERGGRTTASTVS